jgi:hypothetical protein
MNTLTASTGAQALPTTTKMALFGAALLSFLALQDAITHGITGEFSRASDEFGTTWIWLAGNIAHGVAYLGLLAILFAEARRIDAGSRARKVLRWLLVAAFVPLAAYFTFVTPILFATDADLANPPGWAAALQFLLIGFVLQFPAGLGMGFATRKVPDMSLASKVLIGILGAAAFTALLAFTAKDFAHPAYLEATVALGVALLGVRR